MAGGKAAGAGRDSDPKSHGGEVDGQRLGSIQQIAIDNVVIPADHKDDIGIPGLIQSQTEFGRPSPAGIKDDTNRGNRMALEIGGNALLGRWADVKHGDFPVECGFKKRSTSPTGDEETIVSPVLEAWGLPRGGGQPSPAGDSDESHPEWCCQPSSPRISCGRGSP